MPTVNWKKPPFGWKKLNFFGLKNDSGEKFVGGILRDHTGNIIFGYGSPVDVDCMYDLPAVALLHGIDKVISEEGCDHRVIFEGNAQIFINEFNQGRDVVKPALAAEIREKLDSLVEYSLEFTPWETHYAARYMVNQAKKKNNQGECVDVFYDKDHIPDVLATLCRLEANRSL